MIRTQRLFSIGLLAAAIAAFAFGLLGYETRNGIGGIYTAPHALALLISILCLVWALSSFETKEATERRAESLAERRLRDEKSTDWIDPLAKAVFLVALGLGISLVYTAWLGIPVALIAYRYTGQIDQRWSNSRRAAEDRIVARLREEIAAIRLGNERTD